MNGEKIGLADMDQSNASVRDSPPIENHRLRDIHRTTSRLASLASCHNKFLHSFSPVHAKSVGEPVFCHIREGIEMISKKLLVELYTNAKWDEDKQSKLS